MCNRYNSNMGRYHTRYESGHSISYNIACATSEDSDQPVHPHRLIRVSAVHLKTLGIICYLQSVMRRFCSDRANVQADRESSPGAQAAL